MQMVVDKHLKELALTNRRVIIPDLGAFLSKEGDGDEKNLIFSSFLKYNDGFLEKQLADKEKLSQIEASEEVKKFVGEVTKTLRAKHNYVIDGFGFFHMDERGSIAFSPQDTEIATKPVEEKPVVIATAPSTPTEAKPAATVSAVPPKAEQPKVEQPVVKPLTPQQTAPVTPPPGKPTQTQQTPPKQQSPKKSSNNGLLITIVILLVVIIILLLLYFMAPSIKEKVNSMFGIKSTATEQVVTPPAVQQSADTIPAIDSTQIDTVKVTEPVKEEVTTPKSVSTYGSNYYVIVGTFQEKSNADKMYKRCIADGYDAELLPKMGALYPVSIFNSPSKAECTKVMREAQRKYGDAWIFKSRRH